MSCIGIHLHLLPTPSAILHPCSMCAEEITYQRAVREQKLAAEISAAKRERDFYLSRVDKAKAVNAILARKRKVRVCACASACVHGGGGGGG